jgi:carbon monoxide dehydrogenase subunit G
MAKFPTEVERSVTVKVPLGKAYKFFWDVVGSSSCIPGLDTCKKVDKDTYEFVYEPRSTGPISMIARYTARYEGNGKDAISFAGIGAKGDNTDVSGEIRLEAAGKDATRVVLRQTLAPDTPVPRLLQGLVRSFVDKEAGEAVRQYLTRAKGALEGKE